MWKLMLHKSIQEYLFIDEYIKLIYLNETDSVSTLESA